jgi:hypothetical protein
MPLTRSARTTALLACAAIASVGIVAGAVRLLPWLLDPTVPWRVAAPFARGLAAVALEAAVLVGWPVGWALACVRFVESGEARVLLTLGESPQTTVRRLSAHGAIFAAALALVAIVWGRDANAPGRVATELIARGRTSCAKSAVERAYAVPFTELTWLCAPARRPRLVGSPPGGMGGATFTASDARIAGDFREIELDDAFVRLGASPAAVANVRASLLTMHGLAPWSHASTLPPAMRALVLVLTAWGAAAIAAYAVLRRAARTRAGAIVLGAAGPLAALGLMRALERADARAAAFVAVPLAGCAAASVVALARRAFTSRLVAHARAGLQSRLSRLLRTGRAAST